MTVRRKQQAGYNLVEVLIAMALMGVVVVSISALFFAGRRNVYAGKQMTQAISVANRVTETISTMDKTTLIAGFGLPTGAGSSNTVNGITFPNSFIRTTTAIDSTTDPKGYMAGWLADMNTNNKFADGVVTMVITPTQDPTNSPAQMTTATVVRLRIFINWSEAKRKRQLSIDAVKVQRT